MRLNGIYAFPGTFLGFTERNGVRIGLIANGGGGGCGHVCHHPFTNLRPARHGEVDQSRMPDPRSVAEHDALPAIRTPYGPARIFGPRPAQRDLVRNSYLDKLRQEKNIKIAQRRNRTELAQLYRLREGR